MKRLVCVVASLLLVAVLIVPAGAAASTYWVTVAGPTDQAFGSSVTLTGHTATPGQRVYLHYRIADWYGRSFAADPAPVTSDSAGAYRIALPPRLDADYRYYVISNGVRSGHLHTVHVTRTACTAGPAALRSFPFDAPAPNVPRFAAFTATRGSQWAGVAIAGSHFGVIRWSAQDGLTLLARFDYTGASFAPTTPGSVNVVGITPSGSVLAAVAGLRAGVYETGEVWTRYGTQHRLAAKPQWNVVEPIGVADGGVIYGWASHLSPSGFTGREYLLSWTNAVAPFHVVATVGTALGAYVDSVGDLVYSVPGGVVRVRTPAGTVRDLVSPSGSTWTPSAARGHEVWGNDGAHLVRFDLSQLPAAGPLTGTDVVDVNGYVDGVGRDGDIVLDDGAYPTPHYVLTRDHRYGAVPARDQSEMSQAVSWQGVTSFTSAADHLPHFLHCR